MSVVSDVSTDLFTSLLDFVPTALRSSKENFLSELFAYVLRTCEGARNAWISHVMGKDVRCENFEVSTRQTERHDGDSSVFPDMKIVGTVAGEGRFTIFSEHKWAARCDTAQLRRYVTLAKREDHRAIVCFIGSKKQQKEEAVCVTDKCFLWEDVFQILNNVSEQSEVLKELLNFMNAQALAPGEAISIEKMNAYLTSKGFLATLERSAKLLRDDYDWNCVPRRYRPSSPIVREKYGRIAIEFATPDWKPALTVGFLHDAADHEVAFVNEGIDVLVRLESDKRDRDKFGPAISALQPKRRALNDLNATVLISGDTGNRNPYTLLLARCSLAPLIKGLEREKEINDRLYKTMKSWIEVLFDDGTVEAGLVKAGLTSGLDTA